MSADPKQYSQRQNLKCDNSSSSSSGSESPQHETAPKEMFFTTLSKLNINDDQTTSSTLALPTSSSSSDFDLTNEENLQVAQIPGSQDQTSSQVQITGGEFIGANFGPQTTHQHFNLEKHEHNQQINVHHHYHSADSSEQGTSSEEPVGATGYTPDHHQAVTEDPSTSSEEIELCRFIKLFPQSRISENICNGEQISKLTGIRPLAIKFIHYKEEKLQEAKILTKLNPHQNVVSIVHTDIYKQSAFKYLYIAMELCHKHNLQDYVNENKNNVPFDPQLCVSHAKQLIEGLKHIHSNDIIHRDLKPRNILFSLNEKTLKIADFGISKEMTSGRTVTDVTNARAGTDGYRAPETYNSNEISKQTDIFSMGLVFYFLWSNGHHPYGEDPDEWNMNIKRNRDRDLSHLLLPNKETAIDLLEWMLHFNPRERPTVSQILRHQMFGGTEKGPVSTGSATESGAATTGSATRPKAASSTQEIKPSTSKRELNPEEIELLEENLEHHMENEEYSLASQDLQNILEYRPNDLGRFVITHQLAECHMMCNAPIHEDIMKLLSIYDSVGWFAGSIEQEADSFFEHTRLLRAYFMYICASKMFKIHSSPSDAVKGIERCIEKICKVVEKEKQVRSCSILSNYVQSGINEMLQDQASCYLELGVGNNNLREYKKAGDYLFEGLQLMKKHFKDDVGKHKLYGRILKNLADSEGKQGNIEEGQEKLGHELTALQTYRKAIAAFKKAEDYENEDERKKDIASAEQELPVQKLPFYF